MKRVLLCFFGAKWKSCLNVSKVPLNQVEKWKKQRENETFVGPLEIVCLRVSSVAFVSALLLSYVFCTEGDLRDVWLEGDLRFQGDWVEEGDSPNPLESSPSKTSTIPCCQTRPEAPAKHDRRRGRGESGERRSLRRQVVLGARGRRRTRTSPKTAPLPWPRRPV